ncbi:MAG: hypothetical protein QM736_25600 [Vicinamibacterales bacterium]
MAVSLRSFTTSRLSSSSQHPAVRAHAAWLTAVVAMIAIGAACNGQPVLTRLMEARRLSAELRTSFARANEASTRAVLADTDDVSAATAKEATDATASVAETLTRLQTLVTSLGYDAEREALARFANRFAEFQKLDAEILTLAVENTNLKAQRLSFGAAREMGEAIAGELEKVAVGAPAETDAQAKAIRADLYELLFIQSRHIAEADDGVMTELEARSQTVIADARARLARLKGQTRRSDAIAALDAATSLFTRFVDTHDEIVALSRRNTNVRSLALILGRARVVVADCNVELNTIEQLLAGHGSEATR